MEKRLRAQLLCSAALFAERSKRPKPARRPTPTVPSAAFLPMSPCAVHLRCLSASTFLRHSPTCKPFIPPPSLTAAFALATTACAPHLLSAIPSDGSQPLEASTASPALTTSPALLPSPSSAAAPAMNAVDALNAFKQRLQCSICYFVCCSPVILPCSHFFCRACLSQLIAQEKATHAAAASAFTQPRRKVGEFACPVCRADTSQRQLMGDDTLAEVIELFGQLRQAIEEEEGWQLSQEVPLTTHTIPPPNNSPKHKPHHPLTTPMPRRKVSFPSHTTPLPPTPYPLSHPLYCSFPHPLPSLSSPSVCPAHSLTYPSSHHPTSPTPR